MLIDIAVMRDGMYDACIVMGIGRCICRHQLILQLTCRGWDVWGVYCSVWGLAGDVWCGVVWRGIV